MQSIVIRSGLLSLLIACNGNVGTTHDEDLEESGSQPAAAAPAASAAAKRDTQVTLSLGGLQSWKAGDSLQLVVPSTGAALPGLENSFAAYPRAGETTIAAQTVSWKHVGAPLVTADKGETVILAQLAAAISTGDGRAYAALARSGAAHGLTLRDGEAGSLAATLAPVAQDRAVTVQWRGDALPELAAAAGPGARPSPAATVAITALPDGGARTDFTAAYHGGLASLVVFPPLPTTRFEQTVAYGNPFSGASGKWSEVATSVYTASVPVPTASGVGSLAARFVTAVPVTSKVLELSPRLSPVGGVTLDGVALDAPRTDAGRSPTLAWQAPKLGVAGSYSVTVYLVIGSDQGVELEAIDSLTTKGTSLQLPRLAAGGTYVAAITATSRGGDELVFASADHVTAQFTP